MTKEQEELLERAKRDYPVGTKFLPNHAGENKDNYCFITEDSHFEINGNRLVSIIKGTTWDKDNDKKYGNTAICRYVYYDGKWAEIISRPEQEKWEPKVGDWVVITCSSSINKKGDIGEVTTPKQKDNSFLVDCGNGNTSNWESATSCRPALPHEIPQEEVEYWECVSNIGKSVNTMCVDLIIGKVYSVKDKTPWYLLGSWRGVLKDTDYGKNFKPSTRQAYEAQQSESVVDDIRDFVYPTERVNNVSQINNNQNEHKAKTIEVCGSDISIGRSDQIRGKGLDYSESEITVGSGYRTNQGRSIQC